MKAIEIYNRKELIFVFTENQSWLDKMSHYIEKFKPNFSKCIWDTYEKQKCFSNLPNPLDDSITLQELLQQLLSCGLSKENLYNIVTNGTLPVEISTI